MAVKPINAATDGLLEGRSPINVASRGLFLVTEETNFSLLPAAHLDLSAYAPDFEVPDVVNYNVNLPLSQIFFQTYSNVWITTNDVELPLAHIELQTNPPHVQPSEFNFFEVPAQSIPITGRTPDLVSPEGRFSALEELNIPLIARTPQWDYTGNRWVDLNVSGLLIQTPAPTVFTLNYVDLPTQNLPLTGLAPDFGVSDLVNMASVNVPITAFAGDFVTTEDRFSYPPVVNLPLGTPEQSWFSSDFQQTDLASSNIPLDNHYVISYTLGTGQQVWKEKIAYNMRIGRRFERTLKR